MEAHGGGDEGVKLGSLYVTLFPLVPRLICSLLVVST
jgi:hypothetical protein